MPARSFRRPGLLINRSFALLWAGQTVSVLGDTLFDTTLVLWITTRLAAGQPWSPLAVAGVLFAATLPVLVVGPLAGVYADRWDKRRTLLRMDAMRALLIALLLPLALDLPLALLPGDGFPLIWRLGAIYGVVLLAAACAQFFFPAQIALLAAIVDESHLARASGLIRISQGAAQVAGPGLAALLYFAAGPAWALAINAVSFGVSFLAVAAMRGIVTEWAGETGNSRERGSVWRELWAGLRFFFGHRTLRGLLVAAVLVLLGAGTLNTLDIFFVTQNLAAPASLFGLLGTALGLGLIAGSALAAALATRLGVGRTFWLGLVAGGLVIIAYARQTQVVPALALIALSGATIGAVNVAISPLLLHLTPRDMIGRVAAVFNPITSLATLASIALAGYLDGVALRGFHQYAFGLRIGPVDTIYTATGLLILLGGLYARRILRGVRLKGEPGATAQKPPTHP
jgi:MFS family permease